MQTGACPRCTQAYTASDIIGFGILRPRVERAGGPLVEYTCPSCGHLMRLVPHGEGRFAAPGEPPPPPVPQEEQRPPWMDEGRTAETSAPVEPPVDAAATTAAGPEAPPPDEAAEAPPPDDAPLDVMTAFALLGCSPTADRQQIEQAFRERSRTCHPDKVAHLDPDFQALAEKKFKRLRAAYDLLLS